MPKKKFLNRLENLFSQLEDRVQPVAQAEDQESLPVWTWECDPDGTYTWCSPELTSGLGYQPSVFIGQNVIAHKVDQSSQPAIRSAMENGIFPIDIHVYFHSAEGILVPVRLTIYQRPAHNGDRPGYRGYAQVLSLDSDITPEHVHHSIATKPLTGPLSPSRIQVESPIASGPITGLALDGSSVLPATNLWTDTAHKSLQKQKPIHEPATNKSPAVLAHPFQLKDQTTAILELVADDPNRTWTEDEKLLVQEVTRQLSLALENAQLYAAVQQELGERIRAEAEITRRNQDLALLNQIGQRLSKLASPEEIFTSAFSNISSMIDDRNLTAIIMDPDTGMLSYPYVIENGKLVHVPGREPSNQFPEWIMKNRIPILMNRDVSGHLRTSGVDELDPMPKSVLAIPILAGDRPSGAIIFNNYDKEDGYTQVQLELLSTIATQLATALENARLFENVNRALQTIETRERYQAGAAKAVSQLTEFGTRSLVDVLDTLGQSSGSSHVVFCQISASSSDVWTVANEWQANRETESKGSLLDATIPIFPRWVADLREKGWVTVQLDTCPKNELEFLDRSGIKSALLLSVPGKTYTPSILGFFDYDTNRSWQPDEISVLRVAADAISNTYVREDLLQQIQISLSETENLYNASHRLALANDYQEMVSAITLGFRNASLNRGILVLFEYDAFGGLQKFNVAGSWHSGTGKPAPIMGTELAVQPYANLVLVQSPVFLDDIQNATLSAETKGVLAERNVQSLAILPLWASKRQLGVLLLETEQKRAFTPQEIRSYPPLVDQMATTVENQILFQQTQEALADTELLYKMSNNIAQASTAQDLISLVAQNVLPKNADRTSLLLVHNNSEGDPVEFEVIGFYDVTGEYQRAGMRSPITSFPLIRLLGNDTLVINNVMESDLDAASRKTLQQLNIVSGCISPLRIAGRLIGLLIASARRPAEYENEEIRLLQISGNTLAVAIERQRLLQEAQQRALELQTSAEIARDTTGTLSLDVLLARITNLIQERFGMYHVSIFLVDDAGSYAIVRESTGDAGREMKANRYRLAVGSRSVIGTVTLTGNPLIINDTNNNPLFYPHPLLVETRSELGVPLKSGDKIIGALDLQSQRANAFNPSDITVFQILADQLAIAIENARAYELSQKAFEEMQEVDRVKSQFLANMSHELRTPLNSIIGFSRLILKGIDGPINETQEQDLQAIYNSGQHLLSLINNVLDLSKIEAGKMELQMSEVNLSDIIQSVMSTAIGLTKDKPIKLQHIIPPDLPTVEADQTRIRQVLLNLVSNAVKFTEEGSITVEASLVTSPTGHSEVMITVTDSGDGIAEEDRDKLFQPFSQVDDSPTRKTGGTGLGLSICRNLIDMHHGRIGLLWSEPGKGSSFFFTLPLHAPEPEPPASPNLERSPVVLAIDDDPQVISLYERYLQSHGYQVVALTDPLQAVQRVLEVKPVAITLDVMMPRRDGWQVLHELKSNPETRNYPVIICSILEEEEKGFNLGASDYLVKPFLEEDLIEAIHRLNSNGQIHRVLIIDDDIDDLRLIQKVLQDSGSFEVSTAQGGEEGLASLQTNRPDAIILDLFMPGINGFALLEKMRTNPDLAQIPVLILTGADLTKEQQQMLSDFGQSMLHKGLLRENELLAALEEALHGTHQD